MNNIEENKYTVDYFINKFSNISEENWFKGAYSNNEGTKHCAFGHCGLKYNPMFSDEAIHKTDESWALQGLFKLLDLDVVLVNDYNTRDLISDRHSYNQKTSKQRILAALIDIKIFQNKDVVIEEVITKEVVVYKTVLVDVNVKNLVKELQTN